MGILWQFSHSLLDRHKYRIITYYTSCRRRPVHCGSMGRICACNNISADGLMDKGVSRLEEWCEKSNLYENQDLFNRQVHELENVKGTVLMDFPLE